MRPPLVPGRSAVGRLLLCALVALLLAAVPSQAVRNKEIDEDYHRLLPLSHIPAGCEHARPTAQQQQGAPEAAKEYGFVESGLEKCRVWLEEDEHSASDEDGHYERYKCKHLRVHGHFNEEKGRCECKENWKGPICNGQFKFKCTKH